MIYAVLTLVGWAIIAALGLVALCLVAFIAWMISIVGVRPLWRRFWMGAKAREAEDRIQHAEIEMSRSENARRIPPPPPAPSLPGPHHER